MIRIATYLDLSYRRDVMGQNVNPEAALAGDPEYRAELEAELARIKVLRARVGNLAQRDFVSYQRGRAIEAALARLDKEKDDASG